MSRGRRRQPPPTPARIEGRDALVAEARAELERRGWPRLQASLLLLVSGGAAFLTSFALLAAGVDAMAARYALAAVAGYLAFVLLIRAWIAWQRGDVDLTPDLGEPVRDLPAPGGSARAPLFGGGRSGGAGASTEFDVVSAPRPVMAPVRGGGGGGGGVSLGDWVEADDGWWILLALALALSAVIAVAYVVYAAPVLLAEVALDAAVMSGIYRRLARGDARHWTSGVLRRTWIPALVVVLCAAGVGFAAQQVAPEARSIGGVVRALTSP